MSTRQFTAHGLTVDKHAHFLASLFLLVTVAAVAMAVSMVSAGAEVETPGGIDGAEAGAGWALAEIAVAAILLGLLYLYKRFPEWVQELIRWNATLSIALYVGWNSGQDGSSLAFTIGFFVCVLTGWKVVEELGLWWIFNNLLAFGLAIMGGAVLGIALNPIALFVAFVLLTAYDHVFANQRNWMFSLAELIVKYRFPALFVIPAKLRFDWDDVFDTDDEGEEDAEDDDDEIESETVVWGIGTADLMIPAGFAAAVAVEAQPISNASTVILVGVIAGILIACARLRYELEHKGSGAGLPALAAGSLGGYVIMTGLVTVGQVVV